MNDGKLPNAVIEFCVKLEGIIRVTTIRIVEKNIFIVEKYVRYSIRMMM